MATLISPDRLDHLNSHLIEKFCVPAKCGLVVKPKTPDGLYSCALLISRETRLTLNERGCPAALVNGRHGTLSDNGFEPFPASNIVR